MAKSPVLFFMITFVSNLKHTIMAQRAIAAFTIEGNTGVSLTPDAVSVAAQFVQDTEKLYAKNAGAVNDLTDKTLVLTGSTPYTVYIYTITFTKTDGSYAFTLEEIAPNVETSAYL